MSKVSILIPARMETEENLQRTIDSIYENATGDFEIIVGFDAPPFYLPRGIDERYLSVFLPRVAGIKTNINLMAAMATGKYIYKSDAHCSFGKGFDEILQKDMQDDWIVMPRFYVLNGQTWEWQDDRFYDYFYLCCPLTDPKGWRFKAGGHWPERTKERLGQPWGTTIDETPQIHGSGWMMTRDRFFELGGFPNIDPMGHAQEPTWLALKNWLMGGKVMVNKNTWYAHMHKNGDKDRGYHIPNAQNELSYKLAVDYFMYDKLPDAKHNIAWFVDEKFPHMPTWPDNWKELLAERKR